VKRIVPHVAAAVVIGGCTWLCAWQLDRADEKRDILQRWHDREPVALASLQPAYDVPQPVRGVGNWIPGRQLLIDNQIRDRRPGVYVLTPWRDADGRLFLVNRGWAPWQSRSAPLPDPEVRGSGEIAGVLDRGPAVGARLGSAHVPDEPDWPLLTTYFDPPALARAYGSSLQPVTVKLDPGHPAHLTGDAWRIVTFGPERHIGYALTWGTIALVVAGIWVTLTARTLRRKRKST